MKFNRLCGNRRVLCKLNGRSQKESFHEKITAYQRTTIDGLIINTWLRFKIC
jgi:hypothetical protein